MNDEKWESAVELLREVPEGPDNDCHPGNAISIERVERRAIKERWSRWVREVDP